MWARLQHNPTVTIRNIAITRKYLNLCRTVECCRIGVTVKLFVWDRLKLDAAFSDLPDDNRADPLDRAESNGGADLKLTFRRIIVYPGGREEIEGVTPKQLPPPSSHVLPNSSEPATNSNDINGLDE
jgi:hypothetical protein